MPRLLAMSFEGEFSPAFDLRYLDASEAPPADGWGLACYPAGEPAAVVIKEATPRRGDAHSQIVRAWTELSASIFMLHVRNARWGSLESRANTQPFLRAHGGRDWVFAHGGSMDHQIELAGERSFEPVGNTDSEVIFCELLSRIAARRWRNLSYVDMALLHEWMGEFDELGGMSCALSDGRDLVIHADRTDELWMWELLPPHESLVFASDWIRVDLAKRGIKSRKGLIVSCDPLELAEGCSMVPRRIAPGSLLVIREGVVRAEVKLAESEPGPSASESRVATRAPAVVVRKTENTRPIVAPVRTYTVEHETTYTYDNPVEHSTHLLRLTPYHDPVQRLLSHEIHINVDGRQRAYEDVFGNHVRRLIIESPFSRMQIKSRSVVEVLDCDPLSFRPLHARTSVPLVWMPWQRQILEPYLLPPELPESQLLELVEYAMSFVKRNDYDLLESLLDINHTIFREFSYIQGVTSVYTTPFEVYVARRGVCQDFTNLLICLARLLGVPARYTCGYIYTGPKNPNRAQADASHAWAQIYLPEVGWKGFDPTNGIVTQTEHVRVAVGRNYVDATPTSGTIYVGGGHENLEVSVSVVLDAERPAAESPRASNFFPAGILAGGSRQLERPAARGEQAYQQAAEQVGAEASTPVSADARQTSATTGRDDGGSKPDSHPQVDARSAQPVTGDDEPEPVAVATGLDEDSP